MPRFRARWEEIKARWSREARPPPDRGDDEPGSWRGDSGRTLSAEQNRQVDAWYSDIGDREQRITERLEGLERTSPGQLVGKEFRLKGRDSLKDKLAARLEDDFSLDLADALGGVHDMIRYTMQYGYEVYARAVIDDIARMKQHGFRLLKMQNYWTGREYKGINSQWADHESGQTFEVQYHTMSSFEAKQLTHGAYERLRVRQVTRADARLMHAFQREVSTRIPTPEGVQELSNYP